MPASFNEGSLVFYRLRRDLSYCFVAGEAIFLDLESDQYFSAGRYRSEAFAKLVTGRPLDVCDRELNAPLVRKGYLIPQDEPVSIPAPPSIQVPERSVLETNGPPLRTMACLRAVYGSLAAGRWIRERHLLEIVQTLQGRRSVSQVRDTNADALLAFEIASAFRLASRITTATNRCLPRAIAVFSELNRQGCSGNMVFGVTTNPFAAHCWVQTDVQVLTDRSTDVARYTPILVL